MALELSDIRVIVAIAECGSLTRTAAARSTTQSSLSRQLARIERKWGGRMFHRTGRGLVLTEVGERLLPRFQALLEETESLQVELRRRRGSVSGEVRIALIPSAPRALVPDLYRRVKARYPELKVSVFEGSGGQIEEWLAEGHVGIGALFRHGGRLAGSEEVLSTVDAFLVGKAGDPLTRGATVEFAKLNRLPLILSRSPNSLRTRLEQIAQQKGIELSVAMEVNSLPLHRKLVADGCGYTVLSAYAMAPDALSDRLSAARIVKPHIKRFLTLATTSKRPLSFAEREVAAMMRKIASDMPSS